MTRKFKQIQEMLPKTGETEEITKTHDRPVTSLQSSSQLHKEDKGKEIIPQEEFSVEELKNKLRLVNLEIYRLKKASRKHAIREAHFHKMQALWDDKTVQIPEVVNCNALYYTWSVPAIKETMFIRRVNVKLRAGNRVMKRQIEELKLQLSQRERSP